MKSSIKFSGILLIVFLSLLGTERSKAQGDYVSFDVFYNDLSPYGQWIDYPGLGQVWLPDAGSDFVPYSTSGHWDLSNYGWTWVSDYDWGWAPFHYGRWDYNNRYGWIWIPGYEWGPSWVSWRQYNGYYGWAPMGSGLTINISIGRQYNHPNDHWIFVRERDFNRPNLRNYIISDQSRVNILQNSRVIRRVSVDNDQNRSYLSGPSRADVQKATGKTFNPVMVRDNGRSGKQRSESLRVNRSENKNTQTRGTSSKSVQSQSQRSTPVNNQHAAPAKNQRTTPANNQRNREVQRSTNEKSSNEKSNRNHNR